MPKNGFAGIRPSMVYVTQDNSRNAPHSFNKQTNAIIKQREQLNLSENMKMYKHCLIPRDSHVGDCLCPRDAISKSFLEEASVVCDITPSDPS